MDDQLLKDRDDLQFCNWAARSRLWLSSVISDQPQRRRRERESSPLILTGHGLSINVDKGRLIIGDGLTHHPQKRGQHVFFKGSLDLPSRIVVIDGSGNVSLDALDWLAEQGVAFIRIKFDGSHLSVLSPTGCVADSDKVAWQRRASECAIAKLEFAQDLTRRKLEASLITLRDCLPVSKTQAKAIDVVSASLDFIKSGQADTSTKLRGQEAGAAATYWRAWKALNMHWIQEGKHPVPPNWRRFQTRSSDLAWPKAPNRNASHPINAMLNYAYSVLLSQMRIQAIAEGYDPTIGILHDQREREKLKAPSFAMDTMEPLRPVVDRAILMLVRNETFSAADFELQSDGVCRLNPELARRVVQMVAAELDQAG